MRHLMFLAAMTGILYVVDAFYFHGQYRAAIWRDTVDRGRTISRDMQYQIDHALRF